VIDVLSQSSDVYNCLEGAILLKGSCISNKGWYLTSGEIEKSSPSSLTVLSLGQSAAVDIHATHNTP